MTRTLSIRERKHWIWSGRPNLLFNTLKETKAYIDGMFSNDMYGLLTLYDGYDEIVHYDENGFIVTKVQIYPNSLEDFSYPQYHYSKPIKC